MTQPARDSRILVKHYRDLATYHNQQALRMYGTYAEHEHAKKAAEAEAKADKMQRRIGVKT